MNFPSIATAVGALFACSAALADPSPWTIRAGAANVKFSPDAVVSAGGSVVPGANVEASSNNTAVLEVGYDLTPDWRARLIIGVPPTTKLTGTGRLDGTGTLGEVKYGPAVLSLTYRLGNFGGIEPYVGAGINYTIVFKSKDGFIKNLDVNSAFGSALQVGFEVPLDGGWSVGLDARKIFLKTKANGTLPAFGGAAAHANVRLDPLVVSLTVGKRF